ncbi:MAG: hypothetical protein DRO67_04135, partial [Candidatus Asgardarchaeum californiense]
VEEVFKKKEEDNLRKETESALTESAEKIVELTTSLEAKDEEVAKLQEQIEALEATIEDMSNDNKELSENLEQAKSEFEDKEKELLSKVEEAENKLVDFEKDLQAKARFEELKSEGVAATDEKAVEAQIAKIREMEDKEFAAYKAERIDLRKAILSELESSTDANSSDEDGADTEETASDNDVDTDVDDVDIEETADADVDDAFNSNNAMKAMAALLNLEKAPAETMLNKYKELGKALAEQMK